MENQQETLFPKIHYVAVSIPGTNCFLIASTTDPTKPEAHGMKVVESRFTSDNNQIKYHWELLHGVTDMGIAFRAKIVLIKICFHKLIRDGWYVDQKQMERFLTQQE